MTQYAVQKCIVSASAKSATNINPLTSIVKCRLASAEVGSQKDDLRGDARNVNSSVQGHRSAHQFNLLTVEGSPSRPSPALPKRSAITPASTSTVLVEPVGAGVSSFSATGDDMLSGERNDPATAWRECIFCFAVVVGLILLLADYEPAKVYDANGNAVLSHQLLNHTSLKSIPSK